MFGGTIPQWKTLMVACDEKYFLEHYVPMAYSAVAHGEQVHAHVINPSPKAHALAAILEEDIGVTYSFERTDLTGIEPRTYYACSRFLILPEFLAHGMPEALVLDADCLVMNQIDWTPYQESDLALFLRKQLSGTTGWEAQGTKIAAGAVYVNQSAIEFTQDVRKRIAEGPLQWFIDQIALNEAYAKHKDSLSFHCIPSDFMDWEFEKDSTIWTGKGPRKYDNKTYVEAKDMWGQNFNNARERIWLNES